MHSPSNPGQIIAALRDAVVNYDDVTAARCASRVLEEGVDPYEAITKGLAAGMHKVGELFTKREYFLPELLLCSDALYSGMDVLKGHLKTRQGLPRPGRLLLGVVEGDIHDIGKNILKVVFETEGWEILDLGINVSPETFLHALKESRADVVGLSALMTTSMMGMPDTIRLLKAHDPGVRIMVGGAPLSADTAVRFGADGYAPDAFEAVKTAAGLIA